MRPIAKAIHEAENRAKNDAVLVQYPHYQFTYSLAMLERARELKEYGDILIVNPRVSFGEQSLAVFDVTWWRDFQAYLYALKYFRDELKRPEWLT